jgi:hypothetical protein
MTGNACEMFTAVYDFFGKKLSTKTSKNSKEKETAKILNSRESKQCKCFPFFKVLFEKVDSS